MQQLAPKTDGKSRRPAGVAVDARLWQASSGLGDTQPELSAVFGLWRWQKAALAVAGLVLLVGASVLPAMTLHLVLALLVGPFLCAAALRLCALATIAPGGLGEGALPNDVADPKLPRYSVLVPLYGEAEVLHQLIGALSRLDYPADRLEIIFIVEAADTPTRSMLDATELAPTMRVSAVPDGQPRTKPRALNWGLQEASGDLVVVYDAEDEPEPDQLRRAAAIFAQAGLWLGCLQAQLKIYNSDQTWLTRQFAIEYAALFGYLLPTLQRLGMPITLGGTSNHFPRRVLEAASGWDAYNVTEDADLGIRLARMGLQVGILESATYEEAPPHLRAWLNQRRRWLKGWMQTLFVHTRQPRQLLSQLGPWPSLGFVTLMAAMVLSALVHPLFLIVAAASVIVDGPAVLGPSYSVLWVVGLVNFVLGYGSGIALAYTAARRSGEVRLTRSVAWLPLYWLLISLAAYLALADLVRRPHHWHKTPHRGRV